MRSMKTIDKNVVGQHEGKRSLGRPRRRWEDNTKVGIKEKV